MPKQKQKKLNFFSLIYFKKFSVCEALCLGKILDLNLYSAFVKLILLLHQGADENGY